MKKCLHCGSLVEENKKFCKYCGTRFGEEIKKSEEKDEQNYLTSANGKVLLENPNIKSNIDEQSRATLVLTVNQLIYEDIGSNGEQRVIELNDIEINDGNPCIYIGLDVDDHKRLEVITTNQERESFTFLDENDSVEDWLMSINGAIRDLNKTEDNRNNLIEEKINDVIPLERSELTEVGPDSVSVFSDTSQNRGFKESFSQKDTKGKIVYVLRVIASGIWRLITAICYRIDKKYREKNYDFEKYQKSFLYKVTVLMGIVGIITCLCHVFNSFIFEFLIALVAVVLVITSILMGKQIIKKKNYYYRLLLVFAAIMMIFSFKACGNRVERIDTAKKIQEAENRRIKQEQEKEREIQRQKEEQKRKEEEQKKKEEELKLLEAKYVEFIWPADPEYASIPHCDISNKGYYGIENEYYFVKLIDISHENFEQYVEICRENGFNTDEKKVSNSFYAYNKDSNKLRINYHSEGRGRMDIFLGDPLNMEEIEWPKNGFLSACPAPKSKIGKIVIEDDLSFKTYIGATSIEEMREYVDECVKSGFVVISDKDNAITMQTENKNQNIKLSVNYEVGNVMYIACSLITTEPEDVQQSTTDKSLNTDKTITPAIESNQKSAASSGKIQMIDTYGMPLLYAEKLLADKGLKYVYTDSESDIWAKDNWIVTSQNIKAGESINSETEIRLQCLRIGDYVSKEFKGDTIERILKEKSSGNPITTFYSKSSGKRISLNNEEMDDWIVYDGEAYRDNIIRLNMIYIGDVVMKDVVGMKLSDAKRLLSSDEFSYIYSQPDDGSIILLDDNWKVIKQSVASGETVRADKKVTLNVTRILQTAGEKYDYACYRVYSDGSTVYYMLDEDEHKFVTFWDYETSALEGTYTGSSTKGFELKYSKNWKEKLQFVGFVVTLTDKDENEYTFVRMTGTEADKVYKNKIKSTYTAD